MHMVVTKALDKLERKDPTILSILDVLIIMCCLGAATITLYLRYNMLKFKDRFN